MNYTEDSIVHHLRRHLGLAYEVLDAGCGDGKYIYRLQAWEKRRFTALDAHEPTLAKVSAPTKILGVMPGALALLRDSIFDAAICLDVIEHLDPRQASLMLDQLKRVADKVIVFTPHGFQEQNAEHIDSDYRPWMVHRTGWTEKELAPHGFETEIWPRFDYGNGIVQDALWGVWRG